MLELKFEWMKKTMILLSNIRLLKLINSGSGKGWWEAEGSIN
jgi:hypothetical protein